MPRSIRDTGMMPPKAGSTVYIGGANITATGTSGGQGRLVVRAGYIDLGRVYTIDRMWLSCSVAGIAAPNTGNSSARIYPASADGSPPPDGTAALFGGVSVAATSITTLIWTISPALTIQRFYVAWVHDCGGGNPTVTRVSTSGALRSMPMSAAGVEPALAPIVNGWTWTEASYLTTNGWNTGSALGVTTDMPGFFFRVA